MEFKETHFASKESGLGLVHSVSRHGMDLMYKTHGWMIWFKDQNQILTQIEDMNLDPNQDLNTCIDT